MLPTVTVSPSVAWAGSGLATADRTVAAPAPRAAARTARRERGDAGSIGDSMATGDLPFLGADAPETDGVGLAIGPAPRTGDRGAATLLEPPVSVPPWPMAGV